jgi:hypothetical protein
MLVEE